MAELRFLPIPAPAIVFPVGRAWNNPNNLVGRKYRKDTVFATEAEHKSGEVKIAHDNWCGGCIVKVPEKVVPIKFHLRRIHINKQGYAYRGREYYGIGEPLYAYESTEPVPYGYNYSRDYISGHVRAATRESAKESLRREFARTVMGERTEITFFN